jgi:hypothetical protein
MKQIREGEFFAHCRQSDFWEKLKFIHDYNSAPKACDSGRNSIFTVLILVL